MWPPPTRSSDPPRACGAWRARPWRTPRPTAATSSRSASGRPRTDDPASTSRPSSPRPAKASPREAARPGSRAASSSCLLRHDDDETNLAVARAAAAAAGAGVVGLDVAGDELVFPSIAPYRAPFAVAAAAGLGLTAHAAEAGPAESVIEAVEGLGVTRIGHGSRAADDPAILAWAAEHGVAFEVCPTSNVLTGAARSVREHPLHAFLAAGCQVVLGDDDPVTTGSTLAAEERLPGDGGRPERRAAPGHASDGVRGRVRGRPRRGRSPARASGLAASGRGAATRSRCSGPSRPTGRRSRRSRPPPSSRRRAGARDTARPTSTASWACGTHSSERRKTSTMSNGPVASTAAASVSNAGTPRTSRSFGFTGTQSKPLSSR